MIKIKNNTRGFTILELMIVTAIVMSVVATVFLLQNFLLTQQSTTFQSFANVENANAGIEQMVREIRNARYGDDGSYPLQVVNDQNLTLYTNADDDEATEKVQYFIDGTQLKKAITQPSSYPVNYASPATVIIISDGVVNGTQPVFSYYPNTFTGSGNPLQQQQRQLQTRLVKVTLITNQRAGQYTSVDESTDYTITAFAMIRTLKDNL